MEAPHDTDFLSPPGFAKQPRRNRALLAALALLVAVAVTGLVATGGEDPTEDTTALPGVQAPRPGIDAANAKQASATVGGAKRASVPTAKSSAPEPTGTDSTNPDATNAAPPATRSSTATKPPTTTPPTSEPPTTGVPPTTGGTNPPTSSPSTIPPTTAAPPAPAAPPANPGGAWSPSGPAFYVSASGDDGGDGSVDNPWRSISASVNRLEPGDSLLLMSGTYGTTSSGPTIDITGRNGQPGAPITIAAAPGHTPHILGGGYEVILVSNSTYVDIRGLEISGSASQAQQHTTGIEVSNSHHVRVVGNNVHDMSGGGINGVRANHMTIESNTIRRTANWSSYQMSAISLFESTNIGGGNDANGFSFYIRNNTASESRNLVGPISDGNCIIIDMGQATGYAGATSITNNVCVNNGGRGVHVFHSDNVTAYNNTLIGNLQSPEQSGEGELSALYASNVTFRNNLVIPSRDGRGTHTYSASNITFANNLFVGSPPSQSGPGDLVVADAQLGGDRVPLPSSPAVDAGTASGAPAVDIRGRSRGSSPDIGAFER